MTLADNPPPNQIHGFVMPGVDRISELSESLLTQILSFLPTKYSVRTSVLSTRWKNLWRNVPVLDLNCRNFPFEDKQLFINFIDRFLEFNPESSLQKFKVNYSRDQILGFKDRIATAVSRRIQHLDLVSNTYHQDADTLIYTCIEFMPLNLYTSKTLVSLRLSGSGLEDTGFVSLPCLKFMELLEIRWCGTMNPEKLISGCPVLEELTLLRYIYDKLAVTSLRSESLKRFCVPVGEGSFLSSELESTLEIDAPRLEYMSLKEDQYSRIVVKNLSSLLTVDLGIRRHVDFGMRGFLTGISNVRHMIISRTTMKALYRYSKVGLIPKFNNLARVKAAFHSHLLHFLPIFLESCLNLKHLILEVGYPKNEMAILKVVDVPLCLLTTLECVELTIIGVFDWKEEAMKVASYFLENGAVLKKFVVSLLNCRGRVPMSEVYEELKKITKRSKKCEIILDLGFW